MVACALWNPSWTDVRRSNNNFWVLFRGETALTSDKFTVVGDQLSGHGLSLDISTIVVPGGGLGERAARLLEISEVIYFKGRELFSYDDRFDLQGAVEALRALAVVVGPCMAGERHRRAADAIARLMQEQERSV